jgi:hypothetical protein
MNARLWLRGLAHFIALSVAKVCDVQVSGRWQRRGTPHAQRKAPRQEVAGSWALVCPRGPAPLTPLVRVATALSVNSATILEVSPSRYQPDATGDDINTVAVNPEATGKSPFGRLIASGATQSVWCTGCPMKIVNQPDRRRAFLGGFDWHVKFFEPVPSGDRLQTLRAPQS